MPPPPLPAPPSPAEENAAEADAPEDEDEEDEDDDDDEDEDDDDAEECLALMAHILSGLCGGGAAGRGRLLEEAPRLCESLLCEVDWDCRGVSMASNSLAKVNVLSRTPGIDARPPVRLGRRLGPLPRVRRRARARWVVSLGGRQQRV